jgi:GntR family transcriptional regulator of arabinose operon
MRKPKQSNAVYQRIRRAIQSGTFRVGDRIPTERELAADFKLSRPTISRAIQRLVKEGVISRNGKAGSVVKAAPPRDSLTFGAVLWGLSRQHQEESPFGAAGNEILYRASLQNWSVLLHDPTWSDDPTEAGLTSRYSSIARDLIARRVTGVFLMPQEIMADQSISPTSAVVDDFREAGIPVILIDRDLVRYPARSRLDLVGIDNFGAGFTLTEHFIKLGCRRIDFMAYVTRVPTQESRIAGYQRALEFHGIKSDPAGICHGNLFDREFVVSTLRRRRPDAVLVVSDSRAAHVMHFAIDAGIKVPGELRIGSFDDLASAALLPVPLTTMRQPAAGLGYLAYRTMLQRIEEPDLPPIRVELTCDLITRASSGSPVRPKHQR